MMEAKRGRTTRRPATNTEMRANGSSSNANADRDGRRSLTAYAYCEHQESGDLDQHCDSYIDSYGYENYEWCDAGWYSMTNSNGETYWPGRCVRWCDDHSDCGVGTFCGYGAQGHECVPCNQYEYASWTVPGTPACETQCNSDSHCESGTYCATDWYGNQRCSTCHDCYDFNTYNGNACTACTSFLSTHASSHNFKSDDYRSDSQNFALSNAQSTCWHEAAAEEYSELYVGDCGAFGDDTELWCDGYCIANSWLDCCDPKAGAIAALTMGCFFAFVGALFSAAWIFKCWCFKKPNALMLQAMANQQQQRAMAAGHMQSPVVVQMQAPVAK